MNSVFLILSVIILLIPFLLWFMRNASKIRNDRGLSEKKFMLSNKALIIIGVVCFAIAMTLVVVGIVSKL